MELLEKPISNKDIEARLTELAARHDRAGSAVVQLFNIAGGHTEGIVDKLPEGIRTNLGHATEHALKVAMKAANGSRGVIGESPNWLSTAVSTALGAAGGFGGLASALAELPVTTTVMLHGIQSVAGEHGFDPSEPGIQFDCIQVFAAAGPLETDDGADLALMSTRMLVTGATLQALITRVAPKLATVLGQKLAAQTVPVLGAVAGAATNYAYSSFYREMAQVHFGLRRLAIDANQSEAELVGQLRARLSKG